MGTQSKRTCSHDVFLEINLVLVSMLPNKASLLLFEEMLHCKKQATPLIAVELITHDHWSSLGKPFRVNHHGYTWSQAIQVDNYEWFYGVQSQMGTNGYMQVHCRTWKIHCSIHWSLLRLFPIIQQYRVILKCINNHFLSSITLTT